MVMSVNEKLTAIADAIREKTGGTDALTLDGMVEAIAGIEAGGGDTSAEDGLVTRTLTEYSNGRVTSIGDYALQNCPNLTSTSFPKATSIGDYAFYNCPNLTSTSFPKATSIGDYAFYNCIKLPKASFPKVTRIGSSAFSGCYYLTALIIEQTDHVCTLSNTNAFKNCYHILGKVNITYNPEGLKDGYIYVHDALVEDYKAATNWSTYADQIKPLSEYTG